MAIVVRKKPELSLGASVRIGAHELVVDTGVAEGGNDAGPSPHDLYDAALGACKALTVLWYAKRKALAVRDIEVTVQRDNSQERAGRYALATLLRVDGELSDAQLQELEVVAAKCPIHKLMTMVETSITTSLVRMR